MTPPEKEGLPVASASTVLDRIVASVDGEGLGAYGVHVALGDDVAEHRWRSDDRVNVYSVSKGVSALARRARTREAARSTRHPRIFPAPIPAIARTRHARSVIDGRRGAVTQISPARKRG
ncbi:MULTISPECIES: hypothetical protein [unclassified Microbacterium]|uniref:hypothetical protein n=1 Tax=unclassified Microbacterium TaxID=2609290 RepID=UPI001EF03A93|nr:MULTISPECIES: hypothetical protein [unclassified Microbacterium]